MGVIGVRQSSPLLEDCIQSTSSGPEYSVGKHKEMQAEFRASRSIMDIFTIK